MQDTLTWEDEKGSHTAPLYSKEAFEIINKLWLKIGWQFHTHYCFSWMGRAVLQLPEDLVRIQEIIYSLKPDVVIETGIALGGSMLFYASLMKTMDHGRVIGIDVDLRPHNKQAIITHPLASYITLIEGGSTEESTFAKVKEECALAKVILVILDSNHSKEHVLQELQLYSSLVTKGSYLLVADGFKKELHDVPRGKEWWSWDNPFEAVQTFLETHKEFVLEEPSRPYNRSEIAFAASHFLGGFLKRM